MGKSQKQPLCTAPAGAATARSIPPPRRITAPRVLPSRQLGPAWTVSLVVHGGLLALALWGFGREVITPSPAVRLVFVAPPPPPPPPPLGAPEGKGNAPIAEPPPQQVEKPPPPVKPEPKPPKRLVTPKRVVKLKEVKPPPPPVSIEPQVTAPVEEPRAGVAAGDVAGVEGGMAGGVKGGTIGGVAGGVIAAPLRVDQVAHPPVLISRVDPDYPEVARLREIEGRVVLEAVVDREGRIEPEIKVLQSIALLDKASIEALKHWRFTPGRDENGQAVRVILEVPIRFVLE